MLGTQHIEVAPQATGAAVAETLTKALDGAAKRAFDIAVSAILLVLLAPVIAVVAIAIKLDSPGEVFYRCRRIGQGGEPFEMLKFRKMRSDAAGLPLTLANDDRFTRIGPFLTKTKLDEIPQLWNVLRGEMTLVGPRPEDPAIVAVRRAEFEPVLRVKPGVTGLNQLAFADESSILDPDDRVGHYLSYLLPQKLALDALYASKRTFALDLQILAWTFAAVALRKDVAVDRRTGKPSARRADAHAHAPRLGLEAPALEVAA
jgi:lipopolysaccharide/colanic/teichoic acid biosynthesis glycosyltransferase